MSHLSRHLEYSKLLNGAIFNRLDLIVNTLKMNMQLEKKSVSDTFGFSPMDAGLSEEESQVLVQKFVGSNSDQSSPV